jgi:hypothetical protein
LFNNKVPMSDPTKLHLMIDGNAEDKFLQLSAFSQHQGAGDSGVSTQMRGTLGTKFGLEIFANQNVKTHTKGTASTGTLAINNASGYQRGYTQINLDAGTVTGTLVTGDMLAIAGDSQQYVVTNTVTASGNALNGVQIDPPLAQDVADNAVVTATLVNGVRNLAFHRDAFALAMAPLPDFYNGQGVQVFTATDPVSGLAVRARTWVDGNNSKYFVALDCLYGVKTLNGNLATQLLG